MEHGPTYDEVTVLRLVSLLYETVGAPDGWAAFLDEIVPLTRSDDATLHHYNKRRQRHALDVICSVDRDDRDRISWSYLRIIPWLEKGLREGLFTPGRVVLSHEVITDGKFDSGEEQRASDEARNRFHSLVMTISENAHRATMLLLQRRHSSGAYESADKQLFEQLMPHFQRVFDLDGLVTQSRDIRATYEAALDRLPIGVLLVTPSSRIRFANLAAERILESASGIVSLNGRLAAESSGESRQLERVISSIGDSFNARGQPTGEAVAVRRSDGRRPMTAVVAPLHDDHWMNLDREPGIAVFISDPEQPVETVEDWLQRLYELTPAEARLAGRLVQGHELRAAAEDSGIAYETARNHLKHVLGKTGAGHQGELIRLMLSGPASIEDPGVDEHCERRAEDRA